MDISFLSEIWEKKENLKHQASIEELLELKGIQYISTPRPGLKRGGGTAIAACPNLFSLVKLHIEIPRSLEVVWGSFKTKNCGWENQENHLVFLLLSTTLAKENCSY